jgi:hypothetical protein
MPRRLGNRAYTCGPFDPVPTGAALLQLCHRQSTQQDPRAV